MHLRAVYLKEHEAASVEALSWTEYWRALSELCPAFRRYGISTIASTALDGYRSRGSASRTRSPLRQQSTLLDHRYRDPWEVVVERGYTDPTAHLEEERGGPRGLTRGGRVGAGGGGSDSLPRSPGADSFHVLRRKRHAAVALDYESATKELPQVTLPSPLCWAHDTTQIDMWCAGRCLSTYAIRRAGTGQHIRRHGLS